MCMRTCGILPFVNEHIFFSRKLSQIESIGFLNCLLLLLLLMKK